MLVPAEEEEEEEANFGNGTCRDSSPRGNVRD